MEYLNRECIEGSSADAFQKQHPYPWVNIQGTLTPQGYQRLRETLPDISLFDRKVGVKRAYGQGYHDRAILHYKPDLKLPEPWRDFLAELRGKTYDSFLHRMLAVPSDKNLILSMEWYYAWQGCSVSPHCDARRKLATHIFYFNTETDWEANWGGHILILDDDRHHKAHSAPSFDELKVTQSLDPRGNASLLFQRTEHSWHGVRPLRPPRADILRKLFIVTINVPTFQVLWRRIRGKDPDGYRVRGLQPVS